ncbi:MAG TPA: alpha/beta family hydrolase, partial [Thermoanaerobaculia bacterium]|nr:alpha/beta family hydrolase [Thermoanaerobaculia bacterium]
GRIASLVAGEAGARGLLCLGYPFHPPGQPARLRTSHLESLAVPTLIIQGTRDPFGSPDEVAGYRLSPDIRVHWIEGGDHSLKPKARSGRTEQENLDEAIRVSGEFVKNLPSPARRN